MFDAVRVSQLLSGTTAGWTLVALVTIALIRVWPLIRSKIIEARAGEAAIADQQWKRLVEWIDRLERRVEVLEKEIEDCHRDRDTALAEVARLEAVNLGFGQARQRAAEMVAGDRASDNGGKGGK